MSHNTTTVTNLNSYEMDTNAAVQLQTYLKEGFVTRNLNGMVGKSLEEVKAAMIEAAGTTDVEITTEGSNLIMRSADFTITGSVVPQSGDNCYLGLTMYGKEECLLSLEHFFNTNRPAPSPLPEGVYNIGIGHIINTVMGRKKIRHNKLTSDFDDIRDDFYPLINVPVMTKLYTEQSENILILTGEPGTGKTCFVKKALRELAVNMKRNLTVEYVKDVDILKDDSYWANLASNMPDVLVLDDLDDELLPRTEGRNEIVNHLLSFSDGLFDVTTKVIITTNLSNSAIDSAITRPGRCFEILALPQLTIDQAKTVWKDGFEQTDETFAEVFGSEFPEGSKISQAALMSEYKRFTKVGAEAYLYDTSISIREVIQNGGTAN